MATQPPLVRTILVPPEVLENSNGFALDMGGSLIKLVYAPKNSDHELPKTDVKKDSREVRLVSFLHSDLDALVEFIQRECHIKRDREGDTPVIHTTGLHIRMVKEKLQSTLAVRIENVMELKWTAKALAYLCETQPPDLIFTPPAVQGKRYKSDVYVKAVDDLSKFGRHGVNFHKSKLDQLSELEDREEGHSGSAQLSETQFKCLLVIIGSTTGFLRVEEDGRFELLDGVARGGVSFQGLGSLLCDETDYTRLVDMAEKGDSSNVDHVLGDFLTSAIKGEDDWYSELQKGQDLEQLALNFGKASDHNVKDFRPPDIARALLQLHAMDLTQLAIFIAITVDIQRIYFCGSFAESDAIRELISSWFFKKKCLNVAMTGQGERLEMAFIKGGSHLGALGALLAGVEFSAKIKSKKN